MGKMLGGGSTRNKRQEDLQAKQLMEEKKKLAEEKSKEATMASLSTSPKAGRKQLLRTTKPGIKTQLG
jgi:hypothetical protein